MSNLESRNARLGGFIKLILGGAGLGLVIFLTSYVFPRINYSSDPVEMAGLALPGAFALAGLLELITGVPFSEWARRWDSLRGWQRGILGTVIVIVAGFAIIVVFALVMSRNL